MIDDAELLHAYVRAGDDSAFTVLVERYKGLVYGSALRQTRDSALAEEITQAAFIVLARKAPKIQAGTILSGWLFRATRFIAGDAIKAERRRVQREQTSLAMNPDLNDLSAQTSEIIWQEIAPILDEALAGLGDKDRNALLLRFFEQKNFAEVGHALGIGEDGARKRVERALEKLRRLLGQLGVAVSAALLATSLVANAVPSVPPTLIVSAALTGTAATTPLVKGALAFMAWSKTKIAVVSIVSLLLVNSGVLVVVVTIQHQRSQTARKSVTPPAATDSFSADEMVLTAFNSSPPDKDGFVSLFNGRDLNGWNYNPRVWFVTNGVIMARAPVDSPTTVHYMAWAGGEVDDFELRLKVRTTANDNAGVPLRARWPDQRWMPGYQAEIHGQRSGLLVIAGAGRERELCRAGWLTIAREENGLDVLDSIEPLPNAVQIDAARAAVENGEWCDFAVIAQGPHVTVRVNNIPIVDTRDEHPTKFVPAGMLGLEYSHRQRMNDAVEFKEIRMKRLAPATSRSLRPRPAG